MVGQGLAGFYFERSSQTPFNGLRAGCLLGSAALRLVFMLRELVLREKRRRRRDRSCMSRETR
jgi:hypothetical protein